MLTSGPHWRGVAVAAPAQLPTAVGAMAALRLLDVSHNMLTKLPSSVGDLEQLRSLKVGPRLLACLMCGLQACVMRWAPRQYWMVRRLFPRRATRQSSLKRTARHATRGARR
jgi:hypothetical protein